MSDRRTKKGHHLELLFFLIVFALSLKHFTLKKHFESPHVCVLVSYYGYFSFC